MKKVFVSSILLIIVLVAFLFYNYKDERFLPLTHFKNPCEIIIYNKPDAKQVYVTLEFKNAGVLNNPNDQHGISALISKLLFRKINKLTVAETNEKLQYLGITHLSVNGLSDDFIISFNVVEDLFQPAVEFLISGFGEKFSENDLSYVKEFFPVQISPENSQPSGIMLDKLYQNLYPNHIYGKNETGSSESLAKITLKDIDDFIKNNLTLDNLRVYYTGNYSIEKLRVLVDSISKFLPKKSNQNKVSDLKEILVNCESERIPNSNIRDICGVVTGIRLDGLSKQEKAALYIVADTLFNGSNGEFLKTDIPMNYSYSINDRKLSTVLVLTTFVQKKDFDRYLKMQNDFLSNLDISQLNNLKLSKKDFIENQKIYSLHSMRNTLNLFDLPFKDCNNESYQKILSKIQNQKMRNCVMIVSQ